jgi:hypothetical protein
VEAALRLMPDGLMVRTVRTRMADIVSMPAPRVQIMGDSVTAGINAPEVAVAANLPPGAVLNYSLPGTSPVFAYYTLRRELAAGRVPGRIIYAPHPANLETPMIDRFVGRFGTAGECGELFGHGVTPAEWLFGAACRVSVAMRYREEFRLAVTQGDLDFFRTLREPAVSVSQAGIPSPPAPPAAPALSPAELPAQLSTPIFVDPVNSGYIDAFCDLAGQHGIPVTWVTMPVIGAFKERGLGGGGEAKYEAYLDGLAARHPNVTLLHQEVEVYPDDCFADPWHLNRYGGWQFSRALGVALKAAH